MKNFIVEKDWTTKEGYRAVVLLVSGTMPHRCGYVRVDSSHGAIDGEPFNLDVDVHGGITYGERKLMIEEEKPNTYWFGFDAAHSGDGNDWEAGEALLESPEDREQAEKIKSIMNKFPIAHGDDKVRTLKYMEEECNNLSRQLKEKE